VTKIFDDQRADHNARIQTLPAGVANPYLLPIDTRQFVPGVQMCQHYPPVSRIEFPLERCLKSS
jgi:hypothetical protein